MKKICIKNFVILTISLMLCAGCARADNYKTLEGSVPTITVQGIGKVETTPDEAIARFGVSSEEKLLARAYKDNTSKMNSVIDAVKGMGVESKDIKTSSYNVTPIYSRDEKGYQIPGKPASYRVSQQLTIKVRDLEKTGQIIDKVIASGTNVFSGIQFASSKQEAITEEAKVKAAKDAKEKASLLAKSLGVRTGRVLRVNESTVQPYPVARSMMAYEASAAKSAPQIEAGSMEVTATCNVIYEIVQ